MLLLGGKKMITKAIWMLLFFPHPPTCSRPTLKMTLLKTALEFTMRACALDANKPNITKCMFHITEHPATPPGLLLSFWTDF